MPNLINPNAAAQNFYNPYGNAPQYGVSSVMSGLGGLASLMPGVGPLIGAGMNMLGTYMQNQQQEQFFNDYMSPTARMSQMRAAGINPAAAAQGISGAPAPQMNAAAPTGAFTGLGEQLGNSVNTALTASNIAADTKQKAVQAEGQDIINKLNEVELGMKPSLLSAELDDLKESANQKRQAIDESKTNVDKIKAEKAKLEQEKEFIISQIGLVEYDKKVKEADAALKNAQAALAQANKELADVNKQIQEKERDNYLTPEEKITKEGEAQEKVAVAAAEAKEKANVENDPEQRTKKALTDQYEKESFELQKEIDEINRKLNDHYRGNKKLPYFERTQLEYHLKTLEGRLQNITDKYHENMRRYSSNEGISIGLHGVSRNK